MGHEFKIIDAFSAIPLLGNPVAVFFEADDLDAAVMQKIAMEMHLSEVTFLSAPRRGGSAAVRIFTPVNELPFAGHPLIGTARAYLDRTGLASAHFETQVGLIRVWQRDDDGRSLIYMHQPVPAAVEFTGAELVLSALGLEACPTPITLYSNGPRHLLVHIASLADLQDLRPNHHLLARLSGLAVNCFAIHNGVVFNRMFSPAYGVVEDAATGSAAGPLALHCQRHGLFSMSDDVLIEQGHALGKRCVMRASLRRRSGNVEEVIVSGHTAVVGAGYLVV
jgi:trans-2,3-dihydro-3-hydroxyanthranilate isomerase